MNDDIKRTLQAAVLRLLRPLVRLLLHHSVPYETFADLARWVYVDVAEKDFTLPNKKQTTSRISVITGLHRKEVARLQLMDVADTTAAIESFNRAEKVVTAWLYEYPKHPETGRAPSLPLEGERSFASLVKRYSGDMPARAVLDELLRVGAATRLDNGEIELVTPGVLVPDEKDSETALNVFGEQTSDFIASCTHNILAKNEEKFYQRATWFDNIPIERLETAKAIARRRGEAIAAEFTDEFSKLDRDVTPSIQETGRARAVFGFYYYEEITDAGSRLESNPKPKTIETTKR